jgi:protein involved in polysaccharide export with SLBB domain
MRLSHRHRLLLVAALVAGVVAPSPARAQEPVSRARLAFATRSQLDSMARLAEAAHSDAGRTEASMLRERLARGDFAAGDRLIVRVEGQSALSDTFTVRDGARLPLPGLADVSLAGVLRSEVEQRVRDEVARYIRDPNVQVVPLLRVTVTGSVMRPGFYALPADTPLSDVVMAAGGPTTTADLAKVELRRGTTPLYAVSESSNLLRAGATLDQVHMRAGDEMVVGERKHRNWSTVMQFLTVGVGLASVALALGNR